MADNTLLVVTTVFVTVGTTEMAAIIDKHKPTFPPVIAGFALGTFLLLLSLASADIAKAFCILIITSALLINGLPLFKLAGNL